MSNIILPKLMTDTVTAIAQSNGDFATQIPGLSVHRRSAAGEPMPCIYGFGLGLTIQGGKQVLLGEKIYDFRAGHSLLVTADIPVVSHVSQASAQEPFIGLLLGIDPESVVDTAGEMGLRYPAKFMNYQPVSLQAIDASLADAITRLVRLLAEPELIPVLAPIIRKEITVRLLRGPHGPNLLHAVASGTPVQQIAKMMAWLKLNFHKQVRIDDLAVSAHMSPSTFRQHFRELAGMSPLQFQKQLRLQEARRLMLNETLDASMAAVKVGYESPSQFSREYSRLFGAPPLQDIRRLRQG